MAGRNRKRRALTPAQLAQRAAALPVVTYPDLPVSDHRAEIAAAIRDHQVVIVAGETGSGKTTQLPKICLQLGRGISGMIGHTQPRRLAARAVADRIAHELGGKVGRDPGDVVGYQVRFTDQVGPTTLVKLMTDGILLNEIQTDPDLTRYDTIIVDEAHERSLNIDFILGYLARLLPRRPDLKLIITSATIDSQRFADHFAALIGSEVPVIEVSGRTYPVEVRYRPLAADEDTRGGSRAPERTLAEGRDSGTAEPSGRNWEDELSALGYGLGEEIDLDQALTEAVDELLDEPYPAGASGDILVFLPGERDIREAQRSLEDHLAKRRPGAAAEVVPLFARLSATEQQRIFQPHTRRRIILATNIAETSLTVPGIRYVIDAGLARVSRFSNKTKVQRLPIERVSRASADQRAGRAGRLSAGVAIRLYSASDFAARTEYTEPEILRTSLAAVILQMFALGLGEVADFPFIDAPPAAAVRDGVQLLVEIGALTDDGQLTEIGRRLARLPIDPRLGRMLLAAAEAGCSSEVLIIIAALSIQDVRERPLESQGGADQAHARFANPDSDFLTYLNLWRYLSSASNDLSGSAFRRLCKREYLHYLRFREWRDVVGQLRDMCRQMGIPAEKVGLPSRREIDPYESLAEAVVAFGTGPRAVDGDQVHRALLTGLLSNVGNWDQPKGNFLGARGTRFTIWPGSGLARQRPDWVMAAELVETSRLFARTVARIKPEWVAAAAAHLVTRTYSAPHWSRSKGAAMVKERVQLYGLTLVADRAVLLSSLGDRILGTSRAATQPPKPGSIAAIAQGLRGRVSGFGADLRAVGAGAEAATGSRANSGSWVSAAVRGELGAAGDSGSLSARELAREMFLREALVLGNWRADHLAFVKHNAALLAEAQDLEQRTRQTGLIADEEDLLQFFADRVPDHIVSARTFEKWWRTERSRQPELLNYSWDDLVPNGDGPDRAGYPDHWEQSDLRLQLSYDFEPGSSGDGVTATIPLAVLPRVTDEGFDWLVPGMLDELCAGWIRALPKEKRRLLAPAPDVGRQVAERLTYRSNVVVGTAGGAGRGASTGPGSGAGPGASSAGDGSAGGSANVAAGQARSGANDVEDPRSLAASLDRLASWGARSGAVRTGPQQGGVRPTRAKQGSAQPGDAPATDPPAPTPPPTNAPADANAGLDEPRAAEFFPAFAAAIAQVRGVELTATDRDYAAAHLAPHLRMHFRVVDRPAAGGRKGQRRSKELGRGFSLSALQRQFGRKAEQAVGDSVRGAVAEALRDQAAGLLPGPAGPPASSAKAGPGASPGPNSTGSSGPGSLEDGAAGWERTALTAFPAGSLPAQIETRVPGGLLVRGYPGLSPAGSPQDPRADLHVHSSLDVSLRDHRAGVARLLARALSLAEARVTTRWSGKDALLLASAPHGSTAELVADAQLAAATAIVERTAEMPRSDTAFAELVQQARDSFEDEVYQILLIAVKSLQSAARVAGALDRYDSPSLEPVRRAVERDLQRLLRPGFLAETPRDRLGSVPRYLDALALRLERAARNAQALAQDQRKATELAVVERAWQEAREAAAARPYSLATSQELAETGWLLEELRVGLFAEQLGTAQKVSPQRLLRRLGQVGT